MSLYDVLIAPFAEVAPLRLALFGVLILSCSSCPIGVFLMLRRMSLAGDVLGHAMLPGVALGFLAAGFTILPMAAGGLIAGLIVAFLSAIVARTTNQREDASLAAFYLISLALGVAIASFGGSDEELLHVLFGGAEDFDARSLALVVAVAFVTIVGLILIWRALLAESLDPTFLRTVSNAGRYVHFSFLALVVINLVAGFQTLGTLLTVGLMMLPATAARFWTVRLKTMLVLAAAIGALSGIVGLAASNQLQVAPGPAIVLAAGLIYVMSAIFGSRAAIAARNLSRLRGKAI